MECNNCGKIAKKACGACRKAFYCSNICHEQDWADHKHKCTYLISAGTDRPTSGDTYDKKTYDKRIQTLANNVNKTVKLYYKGNKDAPTILLKAIKEGDIDGSKGAFKKAFVPADNITGTLKGLGFSQMNQKQQAAVLVDIGKQVQFLTFQRTTHEALYKQYNAKGMKKKQNDVFTAIVKGRPAGLSSAWKSGFGNSNDISNWLNDLDVLAFRMVKKPKGEGKYALKTSKSLEASVRSKLDNLNKKGWSTIKDYTAKVAAAEKTLYKKLIKDIVDIQV